MAEPMVGEIRMLAGTQAPPGWACCDGQLLQIREHSTLFRILGTTCGGDGKTTFALPDLRGRTPLHADGGAFRIGKAGGEPAHAISESEIPAHAHGSLGLISEPAVQTGVATVTVSHGPTLAPSRSFSLTSASIAWAEPHDNMQPYLGLTFVIAVHGVSPSGK